jgi:hypothetical protein
MCAVKPGPGSGRLANSCSGVQPGPDRFSYPLVLFDDEQICIEYFIRGGARATLVVTFDPLLCLWTRPSFGHDLMRRMAVDVVAVRKKAENFYQPLSRDTFESVVRPVARRYAHVVGYGSSLGAYAALYFGRDEPWTIVASSPRNSTHPLYGGKPWQDRQVFLHERFSTAVAPRCRAIILFDPRDAIDRRYLDSEVLPQFPAAEVHRVPYSGHPSNQFLGDIRFIAPFVRSMVGGQPRSDRPSIERRARRAHSATYFHVLALACVEHRHTVVAGALARRSLALQPKCMPAHRVLGMVALAERRWADAAAAFETALALAPEDPLTQSLLRQAQAGEPPLQPVVGAPAALARRMLNRLRRWLGRWVPAGSV